MTVNGTKVLRPKVYQAGAMCFRLGQQWHVTCLNCCAWIGTMTSEQLCYAITRTRHRGGVLCPDCRAATCDRCGLTVDKPEYLKQDVEKKGWERLCKTCFLLPF